MKRTLTSALAAAVVAGTGGEVEAQEVMGRRASVFDLGVYAGGAYTTSWFEARNVTTNRGVVTDEEDGEGFRIGFAPMFGANATFWGIPYFGVRLHYGYMPSDLPKAEDDRFGDDGSGAGEDDYSLNNHFYDLSLVFRLPGLPLVSSLVGNLYGWAGGGGLTVDNAGEDREACEPRLLRAGACLSFEPEHSTVGQGVVGIGGDVVSLTNSIGIFAEVAAHIYDSPVHVDDAFVPRVEVRPGGSFAVADDRYAVTTRLVGGVKLALGGGAAAAAPLPPPPPPPPPPPAVVETPRMQDIQVCVIENGALANVTAQFDPTTGDTMVAGRRFAEAHPGTAPTYAAGATWFINNEPVTFGGRRYTQFGLPRVIGTTEVTRIGEFQGTGVYAEAGATGTPDVIYLPVRPGCEFQPFQKQAVTGRVRG
jgi:hypothetical protein